MIDAGLMSAYNDTKTRGIITIAHGATWRGKSSITALLSLRRRLKKGLL